MAEIPAMFSKLTPRSPLGVHGNLWVRITTGPQAAQLPHQGQPRVRNTWPDWHLADLLRCQGLSRLGQGHCVSLGATQCRAITGYSIRQSGAGSPIHHRWPAFMWLGAGEHFPSCLGWLGRRLQGQWDLSVCVSLGSLLSFRLPVPRPVPSPYLPCRQRIFNWATSSFY